MSLFARSNPLHALLASGEARCCVVCVERGIDHTARLDGPEGLTYLVPPGLDVRVGQWVRVPLGRGSTTVGGVVLRVGDASLAAGLDVDRLRDITSATTLMLLPEQLELARWISKYYLCPLGMVLGAFVPAGVKAAAERVPKVRTRQQTFATLRARTEQPALSPALARAATILAEHGTSELSEDRLREVLGARWKHASLQLARAGLVTLETRAVRVEGPKRDEASVPMAPDLAGVMLAQPPTPTPEQQAAIEGIGASLGSFGVHLLWGVTGSGKTEVYLRLIERVMGSGKTAVVLVPEIALTPQTSERFRARFGRGTVAVLHSGLTPAQRAREWERVRCGGASVVLGPRSAILSPLGSLGLIVVDEEHDGSYKQDQLPRYHGRDVAIKRAQQARCPIVLGSATPSLESWHNATSAPPRATLWRLTTRATGAALPAVRIVDMREEARLRRAMPGPQGAGVRRLLGPTLEHALHETLERGEQAIILLNRRGVTRRLHCTRSECGYVLMCEHCESALVLHSSEVAPGGSVVRCHHCHASQRVPTHCPACQGRLHSLHAGTEKLEDELERTFASMGLRRGSTLLRLDADSMQSASDYFEALGSFARGEARVLAGTQMLAKGLDFPLVSLVGVIDADTSLALPDFRSAERTFQLLSQVAGRSGRGSRPGRVLIQTHSPTAPAIVLAAHHDFETFAREELVLRTKAGLPPGVRMAHIVCRDEDVDEATARAQTLADALRNEAGRSCPDAIVHGPAPCVLARAHGQFRVGVEVFAPDAPRLLALLSTLRAGGLLKSDAHTAVDVDPVAIV